MSEEILEWQKTFHKEFCEQIFRLWNIPFYSWKYEKKPSFIGTLTNELVYKNLPKGTVILEKIKEKTPRTKGGN